MFTRSLKLPQSPNESFFLWGPRQTGKSTLILNTYKNIKLIDLLKTNERIRYLERPFLLREEVLALSRGQAPFMIIDEIQKVPALLDEVHWLIENNKNIFGLCGSSARQLKRGHANLLGGRAIRYELFGLTAKELGQEFHLCRMLNHGNLPKHYLAKDPRLLIRSYIEDYLKHEILEQGLVRHLPDFSQFLSLAVLSDTEIMSYSTIARDCGMSVSTVESYFQILVDTLLATFLPAYVKRPKRRVIRSPKFYFSNVAIVNFLAKRRLLEPPSELFGKAFENWIYHELRAYSHYSESFFDLSYWRLTTGVEVDFILNDMQVALEAKATARVTSDHLKSLRQLSLEHPVKKRVLVCLEETRRLTEDQIQILPYMDFIEELWSGSLLGS